jgi:geranylgeranyl reductase family protein
VYDLIVVGAGPAGSSAAREAAKEGLQVLIVEKESFPRYKPCGGALSEKARSLLEFELPKSLCERVITGASVHYGVQAIELHKDYPLTTLVTRSRFDAFLLEQAMAAGARLEKEKALAYEEKDDRVLVQGGKGCYSSRFLVVSSGCQDGLKEGVCREDGTCQRGLCLVAEVEAEDDEIDRHLHSSLDIHFGVVPRGYGWVFPHRGYYSVGIGGLARSFSHPRRAMLEFMRGLGFKETQKVHGHLLPLGSGGGRIASRRVLLAGDSAGFVDAFTGEGIRYALGSGQIAGHAVAEGLGGEDAASVYRALCKEDFGDDLRYAYLLSRLMHSRPELFFPILIGQAEALDRFLGIAAGETSYKEFLRWLVPQLPSRAVRALWGLG